MPLARQQMVVSKIIENWLRNCPRFALLHAVVREILNDIRLDCLCLCDVGIAADCVALLELGKAASVERARQLRVESQGRTIIVDGRVSLAHLEIGQPA